MKSNNDKGNFLVGLMVGIIVGIFIMGVLCVLSIFDSQTYKHGQIDCINGIVKYKLVTHKDSTKSWESIK